MRQFPIMLGFRGTPGPCPSAIPWEAIAPYEGAALVNHEQTLEKLASRGGLDPVEAYFVMTGKTWHNVSTPVTDDLKLEACAFLDGIVKDKIRVERDAALLQIETLRKDKAEALNEIKSVKVAIGMHQRAEKDLDTMLKESNRLLSEARKNVLEEAAKEVCAYCRAYISHRPATFNGTSWRHASTEPPHWEVPCEADRVLKLIAKRKCLHGGVFRGEKCASCGEQVL